MKVGPHQLYDIGWAEAVAVELGLLMARHHGLLENARQKSRCIMVRSDNSGVVHTLNKGRSRSQNTNEVLRRIYMALAHDAIHLQAVYVPSRDNIADALSRGDVAAFRAGFPTAVTRSDLELPQDLRRLLTSW